MAPAAAAAMQRAVAGVVQISKHCIRISLQILTTDPRPRLRADAVSDQLSVSEFAICFLTHSTHRPQPQRHVSNPSERGWVTEVQLTAAAAQHGHGGDWDRALYSSICSLCQVGELAECQA